MSYARGPRIVSSQFAVLLLAALAFGPAATRLHAAAVTVREPAFGLPHIYADTDAELARENGREIAKDRMAQLVLLARVGRGTLYQPFSLLDPSTLNGDIEARRTGYTSSELNNMWAKLPTRERDLILEYCKGVNDTLDAIYAGSLPEPIEVNVLRALGFTLDLFGNRNNVSDQVDPMYAPPGGAWPNSGFQFTPEMAMAIGVLEVRNFGLGGFDEESRLAELQALIAKHGVSAGTEIWSDRNWVNDPLAPVTVPDPTTPGYGGPLAALGNPTTRLAAIADGFPRYDYLAAVQRRAEEHAHRVEVATALGAWPKMGSYAWLIAGGRSSTGYPWLGGFPQTGIQTPSIMHFVENRSAEGASHRIHGISMEFGGAPLVLIGQTDTVAYTSTTAQLPVLDTFFEHVINEDSDVIRYNDEGTPAPLLRRTETFLGFPTVTRVFWRSHERNGNKGSRAVADFLGDREGTANSGSGTTLVDSPDFDPGLAGGYVAIVGGAGVGQIRQIASVAAGTLTVGSSWTTAPNNTSVYVAVAPGHEIIASAIDSAGWLEESTTVLGFAQFQRAETILDIRAGARLMPTTHNFPAADNLAWNGIGTASGNGNIGYWSSGFSRKRQGAEDPRLPLDGSLPNPLVVVSGTVASATPTSLTAAAGAFTGKNFTPPGFNFRYQNPTLLPSEYIVVITSGTGYKQTRRIASNDPNTLTLEAAWGVTPAPGDSFDVQEIVAMPEAINPSEGYMANWNNKAATADPGNGFGRQFRHTFILERLAANNSWTRDDQRQLNKDVAGLDGKGKFGRFLVPRLRQAIDRLGDGGNGAIDTVLAALEAQDGAPDFGRNFIDPVFATTNAGEVAFLNTLVNQLANDIYGDEYAGAISVPGGLRGLDLVLHAIDSKDGTPAGAYTQAYSGDYFNGAGTIDHYMCYRSRVTPGTPKFTRVKNVALTDQFGSGEVDVKKPVAICPPADKNGEGVNDPVTHLESYAIGRSKGQPRDAKQFGLQVEDQFGTLTVDTRRADRLLVPTGKALDAPADPPAGTVDHYKCYTLRITHGTPGFTKTQVTVVDQFENRVYDVLRPHRLCTPADKNGEGVNDLTSHLMCYRVKRAVGQPIHQKVKGHINTNNQFGAGRLDTVREDDLCVPAYKNGAVLGGWERTVRATLGALAAGGIPADTTRGQSTYNHPLVAVLPSLSFPPTPVGNRGTYEQIIDVGPTVNGEFIFPLGQSGLITGSLGGGVTSIDPNFTTLHPIWRDWRFAPILHVSQDLATAPTGDSDGDGVFDGYERWYYGNLAQNAASDTDGDGATLLDEFQAGSDPTDPDTDDDGVLDGADAAPQDRLVQ
jgi:hypothetical protein